MRVLVVTTWFPGQHNASEAPFNLDHVKAIQEQGHDVRVVHVRLQYSRSNTRGFEELWDNVPVKRVPLSPFRPLSALAIQLQLLRELRRTDLLHTMAFSSILAIMVPWVALKLARIAPAWVHTEHWTGSLDPKSVSGLWASFAWIRHAYRLPHQVTAVGGALADAIRPFARSDAVTVVPNVVRCAPTLTDPAFGTPLKLVAVGALISRKQPLVAIETIKWLRSRGVSVNLTWVGDGPLRATCQSLVGEAGLEGYVDFIGAVPPDGVALHLGDADIFFLPSRHETFFASAAEAIGSGRGVVICRLPGLGDFLTPRNSVLVDVASPENLGEGILQAAALFATVEAECMARPIRQEYSGAAIGKRFSSVYARARARG